MTSAEERRQKLADSFPRGRVKEMMIRKVRKTGPKSRRRADHITLSQIVRAQLAALTKTRPDSSSVELTRNAKGDVQIKVTVSSAEGEAIDGTSARAQATYDALAKKYVGPGA